MHNSRVSTNSGAFIKKKFNFIIRNHSNCSRVFVENRGKIEKFIYLVLLSTSMHTKIPRSCTYKVWMLWMETETRHCILPLRAMHSMPWTICYQCTCFIYFALLSESICLPLFLIFCVHLCPFNASGVSANVLNEKKQSPVHLATAMNKVQALRVMGNYRSIIDIQKGGEHGRTALHLAAIYDHEECARILVRWVMWNTFLPTRLRSIAWGHPQFVWKYIVVMETLQTIEKWRVPQFCIENYFFCYDWQKKIPLFSFGYIRLRISSIRSHHICANGRFLSLGLVLENRATMDTTPYTKQRKMPAPRRWRSFSR